MTKYLMIEIDVCVKKYKKKYNFIYMIFYAFPSKNGA